MKQVRVYENSFEAEPILIAAGVEIREDARYQCFRHPGDGGFSLWLAEKQIGYMDCCGVVIEEKYLTQFGLTSGEDDEEEVSEVTNNEAL